MQAKTDFYDGDYRLQWDHGGAPNLSDAPGTAAIPIPLQIPLDGQHQYAQVRYSGWVPAPDAQTFVAVCTMWSGLLGPGTARAYCMEANLDATTAGLRLIRIDTGNVITELVAKIDGLAPADVLRLSVEPYTTFNRIVGSGTVTKFSATTIPAPASRYKAHRHCTAGTCTRGGLVQIGPTWMTSRVVPATNLCNEVHRSTALLAGLELIGKNKKRQGMPF